jgi:hypothetical protein
LAERDDPQREEEARLDGVAEREARSGPPGAEAEDRQQQVPTEAEPREEEALPIPGNRRIGGGV